MIRVGVIGLGMMGLTHLDAYAAMDGVEVTAIADADPERLSGRTKARGNVEGQAQGRFDMANVQKFSDGMDLIRAAPVDVVDICLTTPLHLRFALAAFEGAKHLLIEKPLARTAADADQIAAAAATSGVIAMPAMCMRFWPGWTWLKRVITRAGVRQGLLGPVPPARDTSRRRVLFGCKGLRGSSPGPSHP